MIKIEKVQVCGFEPSIRGMRNPKNSWDRSDSFKTVCQEIQEDDGCFMSYETTDVGPNDLKLMNQLAAGGPVHAKYRRMTVVWLDIVAPLYWWKEFDTYKVGTVANSCSTMHKIHEKEFTMDDFSCEHLMGLDDYDIYYHSNEPIAYDYKTMLSHTIEVLNFARRMYLYYDKKLKSCTNPYEMPSLRDERKRWWWQMIQTLPSSYNQRRTIKLSYEVLANIYKWRKNHKLDEWREFCKWIETLPYSEVITKKETNEAEDV